MSFRNTFITDFIYQASDETRDASIELNKIFEKWCGSTLVSKIGEPEQLCLGKLTENA